MRSESTNRLVVSVLNLFTIRNICKSLARGKSRREGEIIPILYQWAISNPLCLLNIGMRWQTEARPNSALVQSVTSEKPREWNRICLQNRTVCAKFNSFLKQLHKSQLAYKENLNSNYTNCKLSVFLATRIYSCLTGLVFIWDSKIWLW